MGGSRGALGTGDSPETDSFPECDREPQRRRASGECRQHSEGPAEQPHGLCSGGLSRAPWETGLPSVWAGSSGPDRKGRLRTQVLHPSPRRALSLPPNERPVTAYPRCGGLFPAPSAFHRCSSCSFLLCTHLVYSNSPVSRPRLILMARLWPMHPQRLTPCSAKMEVRFILIESGKE